MTKKYAFKAFAFAAISAFALGLNIGTATESRAQSSSQEAARFVEGLGSQTAVLLVSSNIDRPEKRRAALRTLIRKSFNLELTSQFVLGKFWNRATLAQRADFQDLFTEYLLNNYARHIGSYKAETLVVVASNLVGDQDVLVETSVESAEGSTNPVWRVRASDSGQYMIIDVSVDGVSLALTQRREFASVVNRRGLNGLLNMLRKKLAAQAKAAQWAQRADVSHFSLLASVLASPNASKIGILLALR